MSRPTFDLSLTAEQRALEAPPRVRATPAGEVAAERVPALTAREEKVRRILLKELDRMGGSLGGLSYVEKQRLEKTLDVEFLDAEIAKVRKVLRYGKRIVRVALPLAAVAVLVGLGVWLMEGTFSVNLLLFPLYLLTPYFAVKSARRKLFIYEALRELAGADEADVLLDRATRDADALIRRIVDRELAHEARWTLAPRTIRD